MESFRCSELIHSARLDFEKHGPDWLAHFTTALSEMNTDVEFLHVQRDSTVEGTLIYLKEFGKGLDTAVLVKTSGGKSDFFAVSRVSLDVRLVGILTPAVQQASTGAGRTTRHYGWSALLSQVPQSRGEDPARLEDTITIGELILEPVDTVFHDVVPSPAVGNVLGSTSRVQRSLPIRVKGRTQASSWDNASVEAVRLLRSLCGLLALIWSHPYEIAETAMPLSSGERQGRSTRPGVRLLEEPQDGTAEWDIHPVPDWLREAWNSLSTSKRFQAAVDAFLEAKYLEERHPSLAAVAYTAAIEAVAKQVYEAEKCDKCGARNSITRSFKAALRLVLPEVQAKQLDRVYSWRSTTVHEGKLHGHEAKPSQSLLDMFAGDIFSNLTTLLPQLRNAASELLIMGLRNQLPPRQRLNAI